jgi:uncharacterized protein (DUF1800 family)
MWRWREAESVELLMADRLAALRMAVNGGPRPPLSWPVTDKRTTAARAMGALTVLLLAACTQPGLRSGSNPPGAGAAGSLPALRREDVLWLERTAFGLNSATLAEFRSLGRERYLEHQLSGADFPLPAPVVAALAGHAELGTDPLPLLIEVEAQNRAVNAMPDGADKDQARKARNERANQFANEAIRGQLLRALYSPGQLREQMVWFWLNHFSVHQHKANLRWLIGDYAEHAIRPHALGHFRDLVLATLEHPAMLEYLDNRQNALGHINENYARELMELHTLGVQGGYNQQDVQQLARVLTGVGIDLGNAPRLKPDLQRFYVRAGAFEFNPARHDFGPKALLGSPLEQQGFAEVEEAVTRIVKQPACARFISRKLAIYFVADEPPPQLIERMAQTFQRTDGDIAAVLRTLFQSRELNAALGGKFKDPTRFVLSAVRFAYDGRTITNTRPLLNWLNGLGEGPFGRQTPDGYAMTEISWASSGQMSRRFEIAKSIGSGNAGLFDGDEGAAGPGGGFPQLSNRLYFEAVEPFLSADTRSALARAATPQEWNTFLLASPEFNYE